jgi:hypothetical protein
MSFVSFLKHVGHDFKVGLELCNAYRRNSRRNSCKAIYAPEFSPLYNSTVTAVSSCRTKICCSWPRQK